MNPTRRVLIAEDNPDIVEALTMMLEDADYIVEATQGRETLAKVVAMLPDLLFLDIWMPGMDGREICEYLKSHAHTKHIPIIMLSANKDTATIAKAAGADTFLAKPFEMDAVLALVKKYTQNV